MRKSENSQTFMNRGAQSVHLGGLFGHGFAAGSESTFPSAEKTYMSAATILSFCTPRKSKQIFSVVLLAEFMA